MKAVFYSLLLADNSIPIGARIVYSQMVFRAAACSTESFDMDGNFDISLASVVEGEWCDLFDRDTQLASQLNCSRQTIVNCKSTLSELGLYDIEEGRVFVREGIMKQYFELQAKTGLKGWYLVVYSYIMNRMKSYKYVDTYRAKLASSFGISETRLSHIIADLINNGWIIKESNWRNWRLRCRTRGVKF